MISLVDDFHLQHNEEMLRDYEEALAMIERTYDDGWSD